jgi:hypothetical protein
MNKHILFVIDHLANPGKYTQEELEANFASAYYAADSTSYATDSASYSAYMAAYYARAAAANATSDATYWVDEYFESTGEDKQTYIDKL